MYYIFIPLVELPESHQNGKILVAVCSFDFIVIIPPPLSLSLCIYELLYL